MPLNLCLARNVSGRAFAVLFALTALLFCVTPLPAQSVAEPATPPKQPRPRTVVINMRDGLRFDPARFAAKRGEQLVFKIENRDSSDLVHNFLILSPGSREAVVQAALTMGEAGPAANYQPAGSSVLLGSVLLHSGQASSLEFKVPDVAGVYPYVCTFPGHGVMMYGAMYVDVPMPAVSEDTAIPPTAAGAMIAGEGRRPFVQRIFMPDVGPASIAVALLGNQNFCWDATECRLRYVWQGDFIDASDQWRGNGRELAKFSAKPWWRAPVGLSPFRFGDAASTPATPKFLGYRPLPDGPEFHYRLGDVEVFEQVVTNRAPAGLTLRYRLVGATGPVFYSPAPPDPAVEWHSSSGTWTAGRLQLTVGQAATFSVTVTSPLCRP